MPTRWLQNLQKGLKDCPGIELVCPVETNQVFVTMSREMAQELQKVAGFLLLDPETSTYRMVTSFDNTEDDVDMFVAAARKLASI